MKIVVIGGTGLIGSKVVSKLTEHGHEAIPASPNSGVSTLTGEGLAEVLEGAQVVVDVSNSPSFADDDVMNFFTTSTTNVLKAEKLAGVTHHVALSVVGTDRLPDSGYMRAKVAQETLIKNSGIPFSLVHATQFYEFVQSIAAAATDGNTVRLSHALVRPIAAEDVATTVARTAAGAPLNGTLDIAGPDEISLDDLVRGALARRGDPREVVADADAPYFGAILAERTLVPGPDATIFSTTFDEWLETQAAQTTQATPAS
ncbi:SDR family oxidoreductase [Subtercola endophyticus]|uniref:SDR family oxidoreductase n=1 Tax=Subtercola endophyticus TaxID=2895559 RepID=UPI001E598EA5|nr:SDR family oxidoreductase [Subtercola endophyticus]UFS59440.1 SDR family oxidoreductase [Subtercola endophyticus]